MPMKVFLIIAALTAGVESGVCADQTVVSSNNATADNFNYAGKLGAGIIIGEPTGGSVKYWLNDTLALDGAVGWSLHDHSDLYVHSDVLWHDFYLIPVPQGRLPLYFGVGGLARFRDNHYDNEVGVRVPVGLSYMFDNAPVDIFVEVAPAVDVAPDIRTELTGGIGIRYWF